MVFHSLKIFIWWGSDSLVIHPVKVCGFCPRVRGSISIAQQHNNNVKIAISWPRKMVTFLLSSCLVCFQKIEENSSPGRKAVSQGFGTKSFLTDTHITYRPWRFTLTFRPDSSYQTYNTTVEHLVDVDKVESGFAPSAVFAESEGTYDPLAENARPKHLLPRGSKSNFLGFGPPKLECSSDQF